MRWQSLRYLVFLGISISLTTCNSNSSDYNHIPEDELPIIYKEIPTYKDGPSKGEIDYMYQAISEEATALGLKPLTNGFDSLQIRIWLGHSMAITKDVVIIKYSNSKWSGQLLSYSINFNDVGKQNSLKRRRKILNPKSGWENLINTLFKYQLLTLPNGDELLGYDGCGADGIGYHFEWATNSKYRWYSYCNPDTNKERFWQARNVLMIADLLEKEFDFTYTK